MKKAKYDHTMLCASAICLVAAVAVIGLAPQPAVAWGGANCQVCLPSESCDGTTIGTGGGPMVRDDGNCPPFIPDGCSSTCITTVTGCKACSGGSVTSCFANNDAESTCSGSGDTSCSGENYGTCRELSGYCTCDDLGTSNGGDCTVADSGCTA